MARRRVITFRPISGATPPIDLTDWQDARPLIDMDGYTWKGYTGGLYPGGSNTPPTSHINAGQAAAALVEKLDTNGDPSPTGRIVAVTVGMSNAKLEFCGSSNQSTCKTGSLIERFKAGQGSTTNPDMRLVNGAEPGWVLGEGTPMSPEPYWLDHVAPNAAGWDSLRDASGKLQAASVTEAQVQIVFIKDVITFASLALPNAAACALEEKAALEDVILAAKQRYPNLRQAFLTSRIYGGWSNGVSSQAPEPYAYESGFGVKWLIEDYINGVTSYFGVWLGWLAYIWAQGTVARSDGLIYPATDFTDTIHPSDGCVSKVGNMQHDYLLANTYGFSPWYLMP